MANEEHLEILRQGVAVWNRWRKENPHLQPDLHKSSLRHMELGQINLQRVNLEWADLSGTRLIHADLSQTALAWATLYQANLSQATLFRADIREANLSEANLTEANFRYATLRGAILSKADLDRANLAGADLLSAHFNNATFRDANLYGANLVSATLTGADFNRTNLRLANIRLADLHEADLNSAKLAYTVFGDIDLSTVKGLDRVEHYAPSTIGIDTLYRSKGKIPEVFLRGAGVSNELINYLEKIKTPECPYTREQLDEWITNQQKRLTLVSRNLADRKELKALHGPLNTPLSLNNEIRELEMEQQAIQADIVEYQQLKTLYYS